MEEGRALLPSMKVDRTAFAPGRTATAINSKPALLLSVLRFEPDILLRAKQEFMKTDSATDLE